jgi:hypothetical protein
MAVYNYASNQPVSFNSFDAWSNAYSSNSNISLTTVMTGLEPADSAPHSVSELRGNKFLYGNVVSETGGTVAVTAGYSQAAFTTHTLLNVNYNTISSVTLTATATYPYTFHSFRDASGGAGNALSTTGTGTTTGTISLTSSAHDSVTTFYAYFTTTHVSP